MRIKQSIFNRKKNSGITGFLLDQAEKTHHAPQHLERQHINKNILRFRYAYLMIEAKANEKTIDSIEYWNSLNSNLTKLLALLTKQADHNPMHEIEEKIAAIKLKLPESGDTEKTKTVLTSLEKFHKACLDQVQNPLKLAHQSKKLDDLLTKLTSASYRKITEKTSLIQTYASNNQPTIEALADHNQASKLAISNLKNINPDNYLFDFNNLEKNQQTLADGVNNYSESVGKIAKHNQRTSISIISSSDEDIHKSNAELDALSEQIHAESEQEISKLRDIIKNQKQLIIDLETCSTNECTIDDSNLPTLRTLEIEQLKNSLRNSENCINTLEAELHNLQKNYAYHKLHPSSEPVTDPLDENAMRVLESTITYLKNEVNDANEDRKLYASMIDSISDSLDANSIEDISLSIYQTLDDLGWHVGLLIHINNRSIEIDPEKTIKANEKFVIKNMTIGEVESKNDNKIIFFRHQHIAGKLALKDTSEAADNNHKSLLDILKISNKIIRRMENTNAYKNQKKSLQDGSNNIKKLAHDVDTTIHQMNKRTLESIENSFGQMQDIARSKGLTAAQIASFKRLEEQTINEISADNSLRLKVKREFLIILKALEDCE